MKDGSIQDGDGNFKDQNEFDNLPLNIMQKPIYYGKIPFLNQNIVHGV